MNIGIVGGWPPAGQAGRDEVRKLLELHDDLTVIARMQRAGWALFVDAKGKLTGKRGPQLAKKGER